MLIFSSKGITAPSTEEVKLLVENVFITVFGDNVNLQAQSVNGQLIQELTNQIVQNNSDTLNLFNNYSIQNANGIFLDFIGRNYNVLRIAGESSRIQIRMNGSPATVIPQGTKVADSLGNVFVSTDSYIIGDQGFVSGIYQAEIIGSFLPSIGTVTEILSFVIGLESVTNTGVGDVAGRLPETDSDYRVRIVEEAFDSQRGTLRSLESELSKISSDFKILENYTDQTQTIETVSVPPHSIWVSSQQGTNAEISQAIYEYKSIGCGLVGNIEVIIDGYSIKFNRPTLVTVDFVVRINNSLNQPPNVTTLIKNTILSTIQSVSKIGETLYATDFICTLTSAGVIDIEFVTINGGTSVSSTILQLLTTTADNITVELSA